MTFLFLELVGRNCDVFARVLVVGFDLESLLKIGLGDVPFAFLGIDDADVVERL